MKAIIPLSLTYGAEFQSRITNLEASAAGNLPLEVLMEILNAFRDRPLTLKVCSLVNKMWLHACRVILFRSINLTPLLARKDWLSVFVNMPLNIGDHVRDIIVKNANLVAESSRTRVLLLSHFTASVTSLRLSNLMIPDFADFTNIVSILKGLQVLFMQHVEFEHNTLDLSDTIPPNRSCPPALQSIYLYHIDLGLVFGWFLAHTVVPKLSKTYFGPLHSPWKAKGHQYLYETATHLSEIGFLFGDSAESPYSNYYGVFNQKTTPTHPDLQRFMDGYYARYGIRVQKSGAGFGDNVRVIRIHKFFHRNNGSVIRSLWATRVLVNAKEGFCGRVVLDVEAPSVREINSFEVDWEFLEETLLAEIFTNIEAVVFLVLTNISVSKLESLIALKMPKSYSRGILRFEEANEATVWPLDVLG